MQNDSLLYGQITEVASLLATSCGSAPGRGMPASNFTINSDRPPRLVIYDKKTSSVFNLDQDYAVLELRECQYRGCSNGGYFLANYDSSQKTCSGACREAKSALNRDEPVLTESTIRPRRFDCPAVRYGCRANFKTQMEVGNYVHFCLDYRRHIL